jgi:octanoyl-[GcvH]:protein N-octanoyltransferase
LAEERRPVRLLRQAWPERPEMGPAISRVLLERVAAGQAGETIRLSRPGRVVAFGRQDAVSPGYPAAVAAARAAGYEAMERLSGGRAAIYFEGALSFTHTVPDPEPPRRTKARFIEIGETLCEAFASLGVDARIGEVPGEYCPGAYSVNAEGRVKLVGVGQRMIRGAAHVGAVIVVTDSAEVRRVLTPVYEALGLDWRPETTGAVLEQADTSALDTPPGATALEVVERAILAALANRYELEQAELAPEEVAAAEAIADRYRSADVTLEGDA